MHAGFSQIGYAIALGLWFVAALAFKILRSRSGGGQEWAEYKARMNPSAKTFESLVFFVIFFPSALETCSAALHLQHAFHPDQSPGHVNQFSVALIALSCFVVTAIPAALIANLVSWLVTPVRLANLRAMEGLSTISFAQAWQGLIKAAILLIPICLLQIYLAVRYA